MEMTVNRWLKDKMMDHVDHALGRPVNPLGETYREYFAACETEAEDFRKSPYWIEGRADFGLVWFYVTDDGRRALAAFLKQIGDKHRAYNVYWDGYCLPVVAESRAKARYLKWLDVSDSYDISFKDFQTASRVLLA